MVARETQLQNAYETTLISALSASTSDATVSVAASPASISDFSSGTSGFYLVIDPDNASNREVVLVTAASGTTVSAMTRDVEGRHTTDPTHTSGTVVRMAVIKEMFEDLHDRVDAGMTASSTETLTNKTFDVEATGNSISNIDVADLKSGVLDTDISSVSGSDDTLASAKAVKSYVDTQVNTKASLGIVIALS